MALNRFDPVPNPRNLAQLDQNWSKLEGSNGPDEGAGLIGFDEAEEYEEFTTGEALARAVAAIRTLTTDATQLQIILEDEGATFKLALAVWMRGDRATFSGQLVGGGTIAGDDATAGQIGEYLEASGGPVSLTSGAHANVASLSLSAGDWDLTGVMTYSADAGTVVNFMAQGISPVSASLGGLGTYSTELRTATMSIDPAIVVPTRRLSLASAQTAYLVARANFTTSGLSASGFIRARRMR